MEMVKIKPRTYAKKSKPTMSFLKDYIYINRSLYSEMKYPEYVEFSVDTESNKVGIITSNSYSEYSVKVTQNRNNNSGLIASRPLSRELRDAAKCKTVYYGGVKEDGYFILEGKVNDEQ